MNRDICKTDLLAPAKWIITMNTEISPSQAENVVHDTSIKSLFHLGIGGCRISEFLIKRIKAARWHPIRRRRP
jgi:hypothetical protein